jgi:hypothetical protein
MAQRLSRSGAAGSHDREGRIENGADVSDEVALFLISVVES